MVVDGIGFGEGPVWCPDGTLVCTSVAEGLLWRIRPEAHVKELVADVGGGANGAALAGDGGFLVTNNGGIDLSRTGVFSNPPPYRPATPGLQRVTPDGTVSYLASDGFTAPNDLAVAPDGTVFFTDPPHFPPPPTREGRVWAYAPDGSLTLVADGFVYCNGIAVERGGTLVVVEARGLMRLLPDGSREWVVETLGPGAGDGFCLDAEGRFYVASTIEHGIRVIEGNREVDFLPIPGDGVTTNCCFGGPDLRWLFATDAVPGQVVVWDRMPTPGLALPAWSPPSS